MNNKSSAVAVANRLSPVNLIDQARLLGWFFFDPQRLTAYHTVVGKETSQRTGAWLTSTLLWLPLLIPTVAVGLGTVPLSLHHPPIWLVIAGMLLGWALTGLAAEREHDLSSGWRASFGETFSVSFMFVFGIAFGIAFGTALIVGLELADIVTFGGNYTPLAIVFLILAFGVAFGITFVIADHVAFAGIFVVAPVIAFVAAFIGVFGIAFVGAFFATFITMFGLTFMAAFAFSLVIVATAANTIEANLERGWGKAFRLAALALLGVSYALLVWLCLFKGGMVG